MIKQLWKKRRLKKMAKKQKTRYSSSMTVRKTKSDSVSAKKKTTGIVLVEPKKMIRVPASPTKTRFSMDFAKAEVLTVAANSFFKL